MNEIKKIISNLSPQELEQKFSKVIQQRPADRIRAAKRVGKGVLIGFVAVVPTHIEDNLYTYSLADMIKSKIIIRDIGTKQCAVVLANQYQDDNSFFKLEESLIYKLDTHYSSKRFDMTVAQRGYRLAKKQGNEALQQIYSDKWNCAKEILLDVKDRINTIHDQYFVAK